MLDSSKKLDSFIFSHINKFPIFSFQVRKTFDFPALPLFIFFHNYLKSLGIWLILQGKVFWLIKPKKQIIELNSLSESFLLKFKIYSLIHHNRLFFSGLHATIKQHPLLRKKLYPLLIWAFLCYSGSQI